VNTTPSVCADPEISSGEVTADDQYICLASDGLWGDLDNKETAQIIHDFGANEAVRELANNAYTRGSEDNITIIIVDLHKAAGILMKRAGESPEAESPAVTPTVTVRTVEEEPLSNLRTVSKSKSVSRKPVTSQQQKPTNKRVSGSKNRVSESKTNKKKDSKRRTSEQRWSDTKPHRSQVRRSIRVAPVALPESDNEDLSRYVSVSVLENLHLLVI
jgi:hypothetical protein